MQETEVKEEVDKAGPCSFRFHWLSYIYIYIYIECMIAPESEPGLDASVVFFFKFELSCLLPVTTQVLRHVAGSLREVRGWLLSEKAPFMAEIGHMLLWIGATTLLQPLCREIFCVCVCGRF